MSGEEETRWPRVVLVCAPPGFGKTTLLAAAVRRCRREGFATAWVNVDEHDNDPFVLWSAVLTALESAGVLDGAQPEPCPPEPGEEERFVTALREAIDRQRREVWLVLDDVQRLHEDDVLNGLELLLANLPKRLHVVISTRVAEPVPLRRLRLAGILREVRAIELCFTEAETAALLRGHGVTLTQPDLARLMVRTDGWPAIVRLAAMALAASDDYIATIDSFVETDRAVADYLVGEVLSKLPADVQEFLFRTSVCECVTVELAVELTGRDDAGALLERLERGNTLVSRCSPHSEWFRYHSLLLGYLRMALRSRSLATVTQLHRVAADWFVRQGDALAALPHAIGVGDHDLMADLVVQYGPAVVLGGQTRTLRRLSRKLPRAVVERPVVRAMLAIAELSTGDRYLAEERLAKLSAGFRDTDDPVVRDLSLVALTQHARLTGRLSPRVEELDARLDHIEDTDLRMLALINRGTVLFWLGHLQRAQGDLERALDLARERGYSHAGAHCLSHLSAVAGAANDIDTMARVANEAIGFAHEHGVGANPSTSIAHAAAAWAAYQSLDDETARAEARTAAALAPASGDRTVELCARSVAAIAASTEHAYDALLRLREIWGALGRSERLQTSMVAIVGVTEQKLALRLSRSDWAAEVPHRASMWIAGSGELLFMRARVHAYHGHTTTARAQLDKITCGLARCVASNTEIEAHVLVASLAERAGDEQTARTQLLAGLEKAEPGHVLRPFVDTGRDLRALLARQVGRLGQLDTFAAEVLEAMPATPQGTGAELSPREARLLLELPSLSTTEEIASTMYVSVNTVKTHLRSIYRKLGVSNRREAVFVARQQGLL
ncbi:LuxR C-terminal-related transcriptional regulator [Actinophytocola gossypii]|uniref:AAA family ATPase n=1 Tax=Actinophytocola gossypii TaxID=2812003 RepID=A0ABT2JAH2_9PSEU|nr:LuxR C-terminal-related transcriptional regulator [Actinophytocola gossypii]MCT2584584.1 AAA family ATPase [Actinophytocola gossypii]